MYKQNKNWIIRIFLLSLMILLLGCGVDQAGNSINSDKIIDRTAESLESDNSKFKENITFELTKMLTQTDNVKYQKSSNLLSVEIVGNILKLFFDKSLINENNSIEEISNPIFSMAYYIATENKIENPIIKIYIDNTLLDDIVQKNDNLTNKVQNKRVRRESTSSSQKKVAVNAGHGYTIGSGWQRPLMNKSGQVTNSVQDGYYREDIGNAEIAMVLVSKLNNENIVVHSAREVNKNAGNGVSGQPKWKENARQYLKSHNYPSSIWNSISTNNNYNNDIRTRPFFANYKGVDVLISLHTNAAGSTARGTQIYINNSNGYSSESTNLANVLKKYLNAEIHQKYDATWKVSGPYINNIHGENRLAKMPSVIIELGFHTNATDVQALSNYTFRQVAMEAVKLGIKEYLGIVTDPNTNNKIAGIFDGAGSIISPKDSCYGCDKDLATMHPHSGTGSTVVFQWLYDENNCNHLNLTSSAKMDVVIKSKSWDAHKTDKAIKVTLNRTTPITINKSGTWTTLAVTSVDSLLASRTIQAECISSDESFLTGNRENIDSSLVDVTFDYYWTGTGSLITTAEREFNKPFGLTADWTETFDKHNSLTSFQWLRSSSCKKIKLTEQGTSTYVPLNGVFIKEWDSDNWGSNKCNSLPCTLDPSYNEYFVIKVKSSPNSLDSDKYLQAQCIQ